MKLDFLYAVEREYPVNIERLWAAWVNAQELQDWYHPTDLLNVPGSAASEATVGGRWSIAVDVPAYNFAAYFYGLYTVVEQHKVLEHTMCYTQSAEEFAALDDTAPHHLVRVEFEDRGDSSWVRFSQFGELPEGQVDATKAGMTSYFDSLGAHLAQ